MNSFDIMNKLLNSSIYFDFFKCKKNAWLKCFRFDKVRNFLEKSLTEKSNTNETIEVHSQAKKLFSENLIIEDIEYAFTNMIEGCVQGTTVLFKASFVHESFRITPHFLEYDEELKCWYLYEISTKTKLDDKDKQQDKAKIVEKLALQTNILKKFGLHLGNRSIIYVNSDYILGDSFDALQFFKVMQVGDAADAIEDEVNDNMQSLRSELIEINETLLCNCIYEGRSSHCETFSYTHSYVPSYSVHDIAYVGRSKKKLASLVDGGIFKLDDIPDNFELSNPQKNQVSAYKSKEPYIDHVAIQQELNRLEYPIYFLDYETYAPVIPLYQGFRPHEKIPFQFSLHWIDQHGQLFHDEYLHEFQSDPSLDIIKKLKQNIGNKGSIVVWHKTFEHGKNIELAERHPEYKEFLNDLNKRLYDLEDIFKDQMYVHHGFRGKTSIKNVLPILVPELSYKILEIQNGMVASEQWFSMVYCNQASLERQKVANDLRKYCNLDTYAMYAIWKHFVDAYAASGIYAIEGKNDQIIYR